jgi:hypothetical protein
MLDVARNGPYLRVVRTVTFALAAQVRKGHGTTWACARCWALWLAVIAPEAADGAPAHGASPHGRRRVR